MFREKLYLRGGILSWAHEDMKRQKVKLSLPAIKKFREAIADGELARHLIKIGKEVNAGSVNVKYSLNNSPWVVTIEVRRRYDSKHCEQL